LSPQLRSALRCYEHLQMSIKLSVEIGKRLLDGVCVSHTQQLVTKLLKTGSTHARFLDDILFYLLERSNYATNRGLKVDAV
jgi:hypothetical protein